MDYLIDLIGLYKAKGLLIDTNLLLLYFIGTYDPDRIPRFKRTMSFTVDEFLLLDAIFTNFDKVITTPNILTEISNLSGQLPGDLRPHFYDDFAKRIPQIGRAICVQRKNLVVGSLQQVWLNRLWNRRHR